MAKSPETTQTIGREVPRKLTLREMGWTKPNIQEAVLTNRENRVFLARFVGLAMGLKPYRIKEGENAGQVAYGLVGEFEGTNPDGEVKIGTVMYLPGYVNEMISAVLQSGEVSGVKCAYDIYARYDEEAATSYVFDVFDLLNTGSQSVDEVKASIKALPMPGRLAALPAS